MNEMTRAWLSRTTGAVAVKRALVAYAVGGALVSIGLGCGGQSATERSARAASANHGGVSPSALQRELEVGRAGPVAVQVGDRAITRGSVEYWMKLGVPGRVVPDPPSFRECIARSRGRDTRNAAEKACEKAYKELHAHAVEFVVSSEWLIGEATQLHLSVNRAAVAQEYKASKEHFFPTSAKQAEYLSTTGRTVSDIMLELEIGQLSGEVYKYLSRSERALTRQDIAQYYAAHLRRFAVPEERELGIVRTETIGAAVKAKRMLASGASFASVAGGAGVQQPIFAHEGLVRALAPGVYSEKPLNNAIFSAPLNVLRGPVGISLGYYVFEVKRVTAPHEQTLSEAAVTIRAELPEVLHRQRLAEFVRHYKGSWRRATTCQPGYVIRMCSEFRGPPPDPPEDPYTF